eukprot:gene10-4261_t
MSDEKQKQRKTNFVELPIFIEKEDVSKSLVNTSMEIGKNLSTRGKIEKKHKKKKSNVFSYLTKAFDSKLGDNNEEEFNHTSEHEEHLVSFQHRDEEEDDNSQEDLLKKPTFARFTKKKENKKEKPISSIDLPTDERNIFEVKFSNVLLYNAFILIIMLLVRIGPNFARPEELQPLMPAMINRTGIEENTLNAAFSLTYYISSSVSYLLSTIITFSLVLIGINNFRKLNYFLNKIGIISLRYSNLFASSILIFIGQLLTMIGVLYISAPNNYYFILIGRTIFSFGDGFQEITTLGYVADEFKNKNFANAVSLFIAIWSLGNVWAPTYHQNISLEIIMWFITVLCFTGIIFIIILGSVNVGFHTHLRYSPNDHIHKVSDTKLSIKNAVILLVAGILFLYVRFIFYLGGWVFPFSKYGKRYILANFTNVTSTQLVAFIQLVYFCRAIASPMLSALIQSEYPGHQSDFKIYESTKPVSKTKYCCGLLKTNYSLEDDEVDNYCNRLHLWTIFEHKFHFLTVFGGMSVCGVCSILFHYSGTVYTTPYFPILGIIVGISLASVSNGIFSFPFIWISKFWNKDMISEKYQSFMGLGLLVFNIAEVLIDHVLTDEAMFIQWWICCISFFVTLLIYFFCAFIIIFFHRFKFINRGECKMISFKKRLNYLLKSCKGLFLIVIDILILIAVSATMIIASGVLNLILAATLKTQNSLVEVVYLPTLFVFMVISVYLVYPDAISRFGGVLFLKNCRRATGSLKRPLVAEVMSRNPNMTLAVLAMKTKHKNAWETCNTRYIEKKILVKVMADDYIASDSINYPRIDFKILEENDFNSAIEETPSDDYLIYCDNGIVQFRDVKTFYEERSASDVRMYSREKMLLFFSAYTIYFLIPIVRNVIFGREPINTSDIGGAIINFMNFFFGFFLLMPQIALWIKIHTSLENLKDKSWKVFKRTNEVFSTKNLGNLKMEDVTQWNAEFSHLQNLSNAKSNFSRNAILFCLLISKALTSIISILALFSTLEVKQALFFALFVEIAVLLFIFLPASTVTFRMEESHKWIKKAARGIELKLSHKQKLLDSVAKEEDHSNLKKEMDELGTELESIGKNESKLFLAQEHLSEDLYLSRVATRLHGLYKLWQSRKPLGYRIDFSAENEFNFRMFITKDSLMNYFTSLLFTLVPAFVIRFIS